MMGADRAPGRVVERMGEPVGQDVQDGGASTDTGVVAPAVPGPGPRPGTPPVPRPGRHPLVGLGVALVSAAAFATSGAFGKALLVGEWSPGLVVTLRITVAALVLLVPALWSLRGRGARCAAAPGWWSATGSPGSRAASSPTSTR